MASRFRVPLRLARRHLHLAGGRAHAVAAAHQAVERFDELGGEDFVDGMPDEGRLPAGVEHLRSAGSSRTMQPSGVERGDAVGDGFEHGFELARGEPAALALAATEQTGRGFHLGAAAFEIVGHVVEAADQFAELFGGGLLHAVGVVSGGDAPSRRPALRPAW